MLGVRCAVPLLRVTCDVMCCAAGGERALRLWASAARRDGARCFSGGGRARAATRAPRPCPAAPPVLRAHANDRHRPCPMTAVGNIPYGVSEADLGEIFGRVGQVKSFRCAQAPVVRARPSHLQADQRATRILCCCPECCRCPPRDDNVSPRSIEAHSRRKIEACAVSSVLGDRMQDG